MEARMPYLTKPGLALILTIALVIASALAGPASASGGGSSEAEEAGALAQTGDPDLFNIDEIVGETAEATPIGIVDDIEITGSYWVKDSVILRQLTFKIGDEITQADLDLSEKRLLQLNGLIWLAEFNVEPAEEEGHVILELTVRMRRTWFIYPAQSGATVGDRNFFTTGKGVTAGYYSVDDITYAYLLYTDPQFLGSHNMWSFEGHLIEGDIITRTDRDVSSGEEYLFEKRGGYFRVQTTYKENLYVGLGLKVEDIATEVKANPFPDLFEDDTFYLSDAWIPEGTLVMPSLTLAKGSYNSAFFPTEGYTLYFNTDQSYKFFGSDFDFSRYMFRATKYYGIGSKGKHAIALKGEYGFALGDPPHYELPAVDYQIRGMGGSVDRGKSYLAMSGEYRFYIWPDILQGVIFVDSGRAWDDIDFGFSDYQSTYGIGVRYHTLEHWGFNVLIRFDYSLGPYDQRYYIGLGQAF
jgi:outer membrane protein assembly factor BamA